MGKKIVFILWIIALIAVVLLLGGYVYNTVLKVNDNVSHPEVTFEIENYGTVKMELYPEYAPNTVANFIKLVENGYYNDKVVYGKDEMCMYLGRDSEGNAVNPTVSLISNDVEEDSDEDYEYTISGEFVSNGYNQNTLRHEKGIVTLIRNDYTQYVSSLYEQSYNSGNAQIGIIMSDDASVLNGSYAAFGKITEGLDIIEKIYNEAEIATEETDDETSDEESSGGISKFQTAPVITSATVDTHGVDYGMPEVEEAFDYSSYMYNLMTSYYNN
jgi:peptidyl-prolyl cis-trans isomerase B (cyclophilin B)